MAVKYNAVKEKLENAPLNERELEVITHIETYIDKKIVDDFNGGYLSFGTEVLDFRWNPDNPREYYAYGNIKSTRKSIMTTELKKRFEDAGWEWDFQEGEDDGPNRPAIDYWHLQGK